MSNITYKQIYEGADNEELKATHLKLLYCTDNNLMYKYCCFKKFGEIVSFDVDSIIANLSTLSHQITADIMYPELDFELILEAIDFYRQYLFANGRRKTFNLDFQYISPFESSGKARAYFAFKGAEEISDDKLILPKNCFSEDILKYCRAPPAFGEMTICDRDEFIARFEAFHCGILTDKSSHDRADFPWANIAFSGGSIEKMLYAGYTEKKYLRSDMDMFIFGDSAETRESVLMSLLKIFNRPRTWFAFRGSVINVVSEDVPRVFQIICTNSKSPLDITGRFDLSHIQWLVYFAKCAPTAAERCRVCTSSMWHNCTSSMWHNCTSSMWQHASIIGTDRAAKSAATYTTALVNRHAIREGRFIKALFEGYSIERAEIKAFDIAKFCTTDSHARRDCVNKSLVAFTFRRSGDPFIDSAQISIDLQNYFGCPNVTQDIKYVSMYIETEGDFAKDYAGGGENGAFKESKINPEAIRMNRATIYHYGRVASFDLFKCAIVEILDGRRIVLLPAPAAREAHLGPELCGDLNKYFADFRQNIMSLYSDKELDVVENGKIIVSVGNFIVNQKSMPIAFEDLAEGNIVKCRFTVKYGGQRDNKLCVKLTSVRLVRFDKVQYAEESEIVNNNVSLHSQEDANLSEIADEIIGAAEPQFEDI